MGGVSSTRRQHGLLSWTLLIIGLIIAAASYWQGQLIVHREQASQLDMRVKETNFSIERETHRYAEVLRALQSHFITHPDLSRRTFRQITESIRHDAQLPGIQAIGFSEVVAPGMADAFEAATRHELQANNQGYPAPRIHPKVAAGAVAYVVQYHEPVAKNLNASWFDQATEPKRRAAIERARDTGRWSNSGRVTLALLPAQAEGVLFYLPVYRGDAVPITREARRQQFIGAVFLVIRIDDMLRTIFGPQLLADLDIEIYQMEGKDGRAAHDRHNLIFDSGQFFDATALHANDSSNRLRRISALDIGGSNWHVAASALPTFERNSQTWMPPFAAAASTMLTLLVFFLLRSLERARMAVDERANSAVASAHLRERAIEACANPIIIFNARQPGYPVEYVNAAFARVTGYSASDVMGRNMRFMSGTEEQAGIEQLRSAAHAGRPGHATLRGYRKDGSEFWGEVFTAPVKDDDGEIGHIVSAIYDVTTTKKYEAELEFQATRDTLTGLANRALLRDRLDQAIAFSERYGHPIWVMFVHIERFQFVVDTLGLAAGESLLKQVAGRLQMAVRDADTVARVLADEFVIVLKECPEETLTPAVVERIAEAVQTPIVLAGHDFIPTSSVGVAVYPADGRDADSLIRSAGVAVNRAREIGGNRFQFYTSAMNEQLLDRQRMDGDMREALLRNQFLLYYQPQLDLHTGHIIGMEALIRWQHPELGMVAPARFIGLAEENSLIVPMGLWVLYTACAQNKAWQDAGLGHVRVAVNLSVRQFAQRDLVHSIAAILSETGLAPKYLDIEVTESMVMGDVETAVRTLTELKALGVHLSIDDFGTGYSSLSYLKRFTVDMLKIDQSFVRDITTDPDDAVIANSIISLAHSLRLAVIAEGVETPAQLAYLRSHGCDQMQGYYFSPPVPAEQFEQMLQEGKHLAAAPGEAAQRQQTLLIVDALSIAASLRRLLRQDGYRILHADSGHAALELLALHPVQVVLCDQRLPDMCGTDFLARVRQLYPDTMRIILSAHSALDQVIDTINRGSIYRFFRKPWDDDVLRTNIRDAFHQYWLVQNTAHAEATAAPGAIVA